MFVYEFLCLLNGDFTRTEKPDVWEVWDPCVCNIHNVVVILKTKQQDFRVQAHSGGTTDASLYWVRNKKKKI